MGANSEGHKKNHPFRIWHRIPTPIWMWQYVCVILGYFWIIKDTGMEEQGKATITRLTSWMKSFFYDNTVSYILSVGN